MVIVVQQGDGLLVHHDEEVQVVCPVAQRHKLLLLPAKVIFTLGKGVPQDAVAGRGPVERIRRSHAAVRPAVLVLDSNGFSFVGEAAVLHAAAIEVFLRLFLQRQGHLLLVERNRSGFFQHSATRLEVFHAHQGRVLIKGHQDAFRTDRHMACLLPDLQRADGFARLVHQNLRFGMGYRIAQDAAFRVMEQAENVVAVEIQRQALLVGVDDFHGCGVKKYDIHDADALRSFSCAFCRCGGNSIYAAAYQRCRQ